VNLFQFIALVQFVCSRMTGAAIAILEKMVCTIALSAALCKYQTTLHCFVWNSTIQDKKLEFVA